MPRPRNIAPLEQLDADELRPLVGADGPTLATALFVLDTWGTSTAYREQLMTRAAFPFVGDLPAFLLINQLAYRGSARPTDLADAIDTGRSNISKLVSRLEKGGLVVRAADPTDQRAVIIALTAEGRQVGRRIIDAVNSTYVLDSEQWSSEDSQQLEYLALKLVRALDADSAHSLSSTAGVKIQ